MSNLKAAVFGGLGLAALTVWPAQAGILPDPNAPIVYISDPFTVISISAGTTPGSFKVDSTQPGGNRLDVLFIGETEKSTELEDSLIAENNLLFINTNVTNSIVQSTTFNGNVSLSNSSLNNINNTSFIATNRLVLLNGTSRITNGTRFIADSISVPSLQFEAKLEVSGGNTFVSTQFAFLNSLRVRLETNSVNSMPCNSPCDEFDMRDEEPAFS